MNITAETLAEIISKPIIDTMIEEYLESAEKYFKEYVISNHQYVHHECCALALPITKISLEEKTIETGNIFCLKIGNSLDNYCESDEANVDYSIFSDSELAFQTVIKELKNLKFDVKLDTHNKKIFPLVYVDEEVYKKTD